MSIIIILIFLLTILIAGVLIFEIIGLNKRKSIQQVPSSINLPDLNLDNVNPTSKVYISFTTIPERLKYINKQIDKILQQTLLPDKIFVNIPYISRRTGEKYKIQETKFDPRVQIVRCKDYGPATKLLGCISEIDDPESIIITIDDDQNYIPDMIKYNVMYAETNKDCCICSQAYQDRGCHKYVDILEGFGSVVYRRKFISKEMLDFFDNFDDKEKIPHKVFVSDDLTISSWMKMQNIPIIRMCKLLRIEDDKEIHNINPLYKDNRDKSYKFTRKYMGKVENYRELISTKSFYYISNKFYGEEHGEIDFNSERFNKLKDKDIVCIKTYHLKQFLEFFKNKKIQITLMTIDSDETPSDDIVNKILKDDRIIKWYSTNMIDKYLCDKIKVLPLGLDYHTQSSKHNEKYLKETSHPYSQEKQLKDISRGLPELKDRPLKVLANYNLKNLDGPKVLGENRRDIYEKLKSNQWINHYISPKIRKEYWEDHGNHAFVLSPTGYGYDCHRTWEALVLGSIVITKRSEFNEIYKDLPVVLVDDYLEITGENLKRWKNWALNQKFNYDKLTMKYWENVIKNI